MTRVLALVFLLCLVPVSLADAGRASRHGSVTCGTAATEIRGEQANRHGLLLYNNGTETLYHGQHDSTGTQALTVANGTPLAAGQGFSFGDGEMTGSYACIVASGTVNLRWKETYK